MAAFVEHLLHAYGYAAIVAVIALLAVVTGISIWAQHAASDGTHAAAAHTRALAATARLKAMPAMIEQDVDGETSPRFGKQVTPAAPAAPRGQARSSPWCVTGSSSSGSRCCSSAWWRGSRMR
jgi:hypothetical protein